MANNKKLCGLSYSKNRANFEVFHWNISSRIIKLFFSRVQCFIIVLHCSGAFKRERRKNVNTQSTIISTVSEMWPWGLSLACKISKYIHTTYTLEMKLMQAVSCHFFKDCKMQLSIHSKCNSFTPRLQSIYTA